MKSPEPGTSLLGEALLQTIREAVREEIAPLKQMILSERCVPNAPFGQSKVYLSVKEASALAGLATSTIRLYIRKGHLKAYKEGSRVILKRADIEAFLEAHPISGSDRLTTRFSSCFRV